MLESKNKNNFEKEFNEIIETIPLNLSNTEGLNLTTKIIAFLTAAGGLSIIAGLLADIVRPGSVSFGLYLLRILVGIIMVFVGYGIIKKKGWVVWLYGGISLISLIINPVLAIIPLLITFYLYQQKIFFNKQIPKIFFNNLKDIWQVK